MLGGILLRNATLKEHAAGFESMDADRVVQRCADDVTLTFMGSPPIVGKEAVRQWMEDYFATLAASKTTTTHVAVAKPWAWSLNNTVLVEDDVEVRRQDGTVQHLPQGVAMDIRHGKVVAIREYLADPDARERALGRRTS